MANNFKNINYGRLLYETLRSYFSINPVTNKITGLYKYLAAIIQPMQPAFDTYVAFRNRQAIIANCKWQIGQLTNVLNYLFDNNLKRIYITQSSSTIISDPTFHYPPKHFDDTFTWSSTIYERRFGDKLAGTLVTINIPAAVDEADLEAVVEQIRIEGIPYKINIF